MIAGAKVGACSQKGHCVQETTGVPLDAETKVAERPADHESELRLWLRLLTCTTLIEGEVRRRLRQEFDVTLPRFDLMAQLDKAPGGMTLGELSQRMMVSNGNVTGLSERLVALGLLDRRAVAQRPPRADREPHARRTPRLSRDGARPRGLDRGDFLAAFARRNRRADAAPCQNQNIRARLDRGRRTTMTIANPVTLPLSGYAAQHVQPFGRARGRDRSRSIVRSAKIRSPSKATPSSATSFAPPPATKASRRS